MLGRLIPLRETSEGAPCHSWRRNAKRPASAPPAKQARGPAGEPENQQFRDQVG